MMPIKRKSSFDWLFGSSKKRRRIVQRQPVQQEEVETLLPVELPKPPSVPLFNPLRLDALGNPYRYFVDVDTRRNEPVVNEKIKDYRE